MIATLADIPFQVPRAKYTMDFYVSYVRFHGKSNDFKMMYKDISEVIKLPRNERD